MRCRVQQAPLKIAPSTFYLLKFCGSFVNRRIPRNLIAVAHESCEELNQVNAALFGQVEFADSVGESLLTDQNIKTDAMK